MDKEEYYARQIRFDDKTISGTLKQAQAIDDFERGIKTHTLGWPFVL